MSSAQEIIRSRIGVVTYLAPPGSLVKGDSLNSLRIQIDACVAAFETSVVIDFVNVKSMDSEGVELIAECADTLLRLGGSLTVANVRDVISDVFRVVRLDAKIVLGNENPEPAPRVAPITDLAGMRLGDALLARGVATAEQIDLGLQQQQATGRRLGQVLVDGGHVQDSDLLDVLSEQLNIPYVSLRTGTFDESTVRLIEASTAIRLNVVPLFKVRNTLYVASPDPQAIPSFDAVRHLTGCNIEPVLARATDIQTVIREAHGGKNDLGELITGLDSDGEIELVEDKVLEDLSSIDELASGSPVINLVNGLIQRAVRDGASDIHIEPTTKATRIRFRIDGILYQVMSPPGEFHPALISRLKVMAGLDIAERRLPQDGRIQVYTQGRTIDLRFSSLPGVLGEKVVLRVLDKSRALTDINNLGMNDAVLGDFRGLLDRSHGLFLVTGPTGSGKTTTLYAAINQLASPEASVVTIEDPVEYQLDTINQNQVRDAVGLGFARILKHVLRQDPDVVMIGEIRERETAETAVQAALTGHLVLSTLHTNDSIGAIVRLVDMGVEPYLLSSALVGVLAQRLIRRVCPECRTEFVCPPGLLEPYGVSGDGIRLSRGRGCQNCFDSGYAGRAPIHELLLCDEATQALTINNPSRDALDSHLKERGVRTLVDSGIERVLRGETTLEEIKRIVNA